MGEKTEAGEHLATLKVMSLEQEPSYVSEACDSKKEAEQSAAQKMLEEFAEDVESLKKDKDVFKGHEKRKAVTEAPEGDDAIKPKKGKQMKKCNEEALKSYYGKSKLFDLLAKYTKRALTKDEVKFTTEEVLEGKIKFYKSTVELPCVVEKFGDTAWTGEKSKGIKDAEHSAAEAAVCALLEDEQMKQIWNQKLAGKAHMAAMYHTGFNPFDAEAKKEYMSMIKMRLPVIEEEVGGSLSSIKKGHGFIIPDKAIEHPMAAKSDGKLYFSFNDIDSGVADASSPPAWMKEGAECTFKVYADLQGLGACNIKPKEE